MGFKRTTDGRVFFSNPEDKPSANGAAGAGVANGAARGGDPTQAQIVSLLKTLNMRLQSTQADRANLQRELESYKAMILSLQDKSEKYERKAQELEKKISDTDTAAALKKSEESRQMAAEALKEFEEARKLLLEIEEKTHKTDLALKQTQTRTVKVEEDVRQKWSALEQHQKKQAHDVLARLELSEMEQKALGGKVEEALATSLRVDRKLEKSVQERARFLRKLERIEETVLQTHEALNARAMVLLTDQGAQAAGSPVQNMLAADGLSALRAPLLADENSDQADLPWWRINTKLSASSVTALMVGGILAGWMISQVQLPRVNITPEMESELSAAGFDAPVSEAQSSAEAAPESVLSWPENNTPQDIAPAEPSATATAQADAVADDVTAAQTPSAETSSLNASVEDLGQANDIGAIDLNDEEKLLALLEENPDALAEQLNAIEPSSLPPAAQSEPQPAQQKADMTQAAQVPSEPALPAVTMPPADMPLPSELKGSLADRITPDANLVGPIKDIESKAFAGNAEAQHDIAAIYIAGHGGVKQDYARASQWFEEAAHGGVANARYNLGVLYHQGIGVKQDLSKAFTWYETAAALNHPEAQYNLGIAYIEGVGVEYDPRKAEMYFKNAANGGVMEAAYNLGLIYENGLLGKAQPDQALMWYKRAADKGSPEAKSALEQLAKTVGIKLDDVNRLVEGMQVLEGGEASAVSQQPQKPAGSTPAATKPSAPEKQSAADKPLKAKASNMIADVQEQLMLLGLYPGPADGVNGMLTSDAIRTYQAARDMPVTGSVSAELLAQMQRDVVDEASSLKMAQ